MPAAGAAKFALGWMTGRAGSAYGTRSGAAVSLLRVSRILTAHVCLLNTDFGRKSRGPLSDIHKEKGCAQSWCVGVNRANSAPSPGDAKAGHPGSDVIGRGRGGKPPR